MTFNSILLLVKFLLFRTKKVRTVKVSCAIFLCMLIHWFLSDKLEHGEILYDDQQQAYTSIYVCSNIYVLLKRTNLYWKPTLKSMCPWEFCHVSSHPLYGINCKSPHFKQLEQLCQLGLRFLINISALWEQSETNL